jgi:hypothetical protein
MNYLSNDLLSFDRKPETIAAIFEMFSVLEDMERETITIFSMEKQALDCIVKDPIDIIKLDFPHSAFFGEYFLWFHGHPNRIKLPVWTLDNDKTDLFLNCLKTSIKYYLLHKTKLYILKPQYNLMELFCKVFENELEELSYYKN